MLGPPTLPYLVGVFQFYEDRAALTRLNKQLRFLLFLVPLSLALENCIVTELVICIFQNQDCPLQLTTDIPAGQTVARPLQLRNSTPYECWWKVEIAPCYEKVENSRHSSSVSLAARKQTCRLCPAKSDALTSSLTQELLTQEAGSRTFFLLSSLKRFWVNKIMSLYRNGSWITILVTRVQLNFQGRRRSRNDST